MKAVRIKWNALVLALIMMLSLTACGEKTGSKEAGTYKLTAMEMQGMSMDLEKLSEMAGSEISIALELGKDGNFSLDMSALGEAESLSGTWKAEDGGVALTAEEETIHAVLDGKTLTLEEDGMSMTFEKQ